MATLLLLLVKMGKIRNISQTVRDREISSKFLNHRVVLEYPMLRGKWFGELWPTYSPPQNEYMRIISKSIAGSQFFSNNSFTYFWESFHLVKFQMRS